MRKADTFFRAGLLAALAAGWVLGAAGCGSNESGDASGGHAHSVKKARKAATKTGQQDLADMVAGVSSAKSGPPVELKFSLPSRPEVGQVVELDVALIPRAPIPDSIAASFQAAEGLEIVEGSQLERTDKLVEGTAIRHVVKIRPKRDGIFALTAVVSFVIENQDSIRTFSIPVIAGEGLPDQDTKGP